MKNLSETIEDLQKQLKKLNEEYIEAKNILMKVYDDLHNEDEEDKGILKKIKEFMNLD